MSARMPVTLGSNIASLTAQRQLGKATAELAQVFERLSSGLRINHASDDAAGLAVASSLSASKRIFDQGVRNLNDGISVMNIADGAFGELTSLVTRITELAEQSANGTYSGTQRKVLDQEAQALSKEFTRILQSTSFNGSGVLNGATDDLRLQAGFGVDGSLAVGVGNYLGAGTLTGKATFATETGTSGQSYATTLGDLNNDGILDLVTAGYANSGSNQGQASVRLGQGDGTFGSKTTYATETNISGMSYAVSLGDLNGDGILDMVTAGYVWNGSNTLGQATILIGRGDGTFGSKATFTTETGTTGLSFALTLGDLNGDGILDLVTAGYATNGSAQAQATVRLGLGDGTFGNKTTYATETGTSGQSKAVALGDLNGDGILDIATAGYAWNGSQQGQATVLLGRGDGTFGSKTTYATETGTSGKSFAVALGDLNGDGILDLATAGLASSQGQATVRLGRGDGTFDTQTTYATETGTSAESRAISLGDLNGDGTLDLITAGNAVNGSEQGRASIRLGRGDGTFGSKTTYATETGTSGKSFAVTLGDLNGDGILDLASAGSTFNGSNQGQATRLLGSSRSGVNPLLPFSLKTQTDAKWALTLMQQKQDLLSSQRSIIGANHSRIGIATSNLSSTSENYAAAANRITDADVAVESSNLARQQILQQSATAILSQANLQPSLALQLLRS